MRVMRYFVLILLILYTFSCVTERKPINTITPEMKKKRDTVIKDEEAKEGTQNRVVWINKPLDSQILAGDQQKKKDGKYLMNFDQMLISEFIDVMMSKIFKENYLLDTQVRNMPAKITIKMNNSLPEDKTFQLFVKIISLHNVIVEKKDDVYFFTKGKMEYAMGGKPIIYGREIPKGIIFESFDEIVVMVPFYNIDPAILQKTIAKEVSAQTVLNTFKGLNLLFISGKYEEVKYVMTLIRLLDRVQFKEKSIAMLALKYWDVESFITKVKELLEAEGINWKNVEAQKSLYFIPLENFNKLLIISPVNDWVERIIYWMEKLDIPKAAGKAKKVYLYRLRNVDLESVVEVMKEYQKEIETKTRKLGPGGPGPAKKGQATSKRINIVGEDVSIIPVKKTNSLVILAEPVKYQKYLNILKKIDIPRNQIFVEAIIGEISINTTEQLGLEFWVNRYLNRVELGTKGGLGISKASSDGQTTISPGSNMFIRGVLPGTQYEVILNALLTESKINILSSPKITVMENEKAKILVGADVPVLTSQSGNMGGYNNQNTNQQQNTTGGGISSGGVGFYPYQSISYISTGVILEIEASILSENKVMLKINQEVSDAQENEKSTISSPEILKRQIETTMVVHESEVGFIGGMIKRNVVDTSSAVPILSKIPLLGNLFKKKSKEVRKTELVVFINAKIIRKNSEMKQIVDRVKSIINNDMGETNEKEK